MKRMIEIIDSNLVGRELTSTVVVPSDLRKYFKSFKLVTKYDTDVSAEKSILNIPMISLMLPIAWLSGVNIHVDELDKAYKESMDELKLTLMKMYPVAPFTTQIHADELVENQIGSLDPEEHTALLYSGGVDSTYSLLSNLESKPRLIMHGARVPASKIYWEKITSIYSELADRLGIQFHITNTNAIELLHRKRIEHDFHEMLFDGTLWTRLQASLVTLPLTAPLSIGRFDRLLIAGSFDPTYPIDRHPNIFYPTTDEIIGWADLTVRHDGFIPRTEKIAGVIKDYLTNNELTIHACFQHQFIKRSREDLNCGHCEKCLRMIATCILLDMDPKDCGFSADEADFNFLRNMIEKKKLDAENLEIFWKPIQEMIPDNIDNNINGSKEFFEWLRGLDLKSVEKDVQLYRDIYYMLPFSFAEILDKAYRTLGIKVHDSNPARKTQ